MATPGMFMKAVQARAPQLTKLIRPNLGASLFFFSNFATRPHVSVDDGFAAVRSQEDRSESRSAPGRPRARVDSLEQSARADQDQNGRPQLARRDDAFRGNALLHVTVRFGAAVTADKAPEKTAAETPSGHSFKAGRGKAASYELINWSEMGRSGRTIRGTPIRGERGKDKRQGGRDSPKLVRQLALGTCETRCWHFRPI